MLTISHCFGFDRINVSSPRLKVLCIESRRDIKSICLKEAKNLTDLTLIMENHVENFEQISISDFINGLPKIERLCLRGEYYIEILSTGIIMQMLQKSLKISGIGWCGSQSIKRYFVYCFFT